MGTPHKHAELIKAWADGAKIQGLFGGETWRDVDTPSWQVHRQYRIKPEPKKVQIRFFEDTSGFVRCWLSTNLGSLQEVETMSMFKRWLSPIEEREFDV